MLDRKLKLLTVLILAASSVTVVNAEEKNYEKVDDSLSLFCSKKETSFQESIEVGKPVQVNLNAGPFALVQSESTFDAAKELLSEEMLKMGVTSECAEYLISTGSVKTYQQGDVFARVFFDLNKANLTKESRYILNSVIEKLKSKPSSLLLEGHTDSTGTDDYNFSLGLKRSEAAKQYLINGGANKSLLSAISKGETAPVADNSTFDGRKQNRRVDLVQSEVTN